MAIGQLISSLGRSFSTHLMGGTGRRLPADKGADAGVDTRRFWDLRWSIRECPP